MTDYFVHESSYIDEDVEIGEGTGSGKGVPWART